MFHLRIHSHRRCLCQRRAARRRPTPRPKFRPGRPWWRPPPTSRRRRRRSPPPTFQRHRLPLRVSVFPVGSGPKRLVRTAGVFWPDPRYRHLMQNEEKGPIIIFARFLTKTTVTNWSKERKTSNSLVCQLLRAKKEPEWSTTSIICCVDERANQENWMLWI